MSLTLQKGLQQFLIVLANSVYVCARVCVCVCVFTEQKKLGKNFSDVMCTSQLPPAFAFL